MSNKPVVLFAANIEADGSSASFSINLLTGPVFLQPPTPDANTPPFVSSVLSSSPSAVDGLSFLDAGFSSIAIDSSSYSTLTGTLTVNLHSAPSAGVGRLSGRLVY